MSVLHMQWLLYYRTSSFSGLKLNVSYASQATAENTHQGLFTIRLFAQIYNSKTTGCLQLYYTLNDSFNTEHASFMFRAANKLQPTSLYIHVHHCLLILYASTNHNKTQGTYYCIAHQTTIFLPRINHLEIPSDVWLMGCHPAAIVVSLHFMY